MENTMSFWLLGQAALCIGAGCFAAYRAHVLREERGILSEREQRDDAEFDAWLEAARGGPTWIEMPLHGAIIPEYYGSNRIDGRGPYRWWTYPTELEAQRGWNVDAVVQDEPHEWR